MSKTSTSKASKHAAKSATDWPRVSKMRDSDIDLDGAPEVTAEMAAGGVVRVGGKVVPRGKKRLTMYLDNSVVEFFKARAGERGYQTLINEALKQAVERETLEDTLRRVLREETAVYNAGKKSR
jgi:uncharacterized protein (DUF4415 family)